MRVPLPSHFPWLGDTGAMRQTAASGVLPVVLARVLSVAGLLTMAAGTFLPWFRSGTALRSSYQTAALADHLDIVENPLVSGALTAWVAVPLLCAAGSALLILRLDRTAVSLIAITAVATGTVSVFAVVQAGDTAAMVSVTRAGPVTTALGTLVALAGAAMVIALGRRRKARQQEGQVAQR